MRNAKVRHWGAIHGATALLAACMFTGGVSSFFLPTARAQNSDPAAPASGPLPDPIYWKQNLFLIPYQWGSAAEPGAAQAVWLFVSQDHGLTWHKISEAKPHVKSFNYRAEGEGEYWFAIRTLDQQGRAWPAGEYQPELRVVVDTTMPRIEELLASLRDDGALDIRWRGSDVNLDPYSWKIEAQTEPAGPWQPVPLDGAGNSGQMTWQPPVGRPPLAIRATVADFAGNSATFRADVSTTPILGSVFQRLPDPRAATPLPSASPMAQPVTTPASPTGDSVFKPPAFAPANPPSGWMSSSAAAAATPQVVSPADQPWPAGTIARAPFRLSTSGAAPTDDGVTAYGNPAGVGAPLAMPAAEPHGGEPRIPARYATNSDANHGPGRPGQSGNDDGPSFSPLQPYREASVPPLPSHANHAAMPAETATRPGRTTDEFQPPPNDAYVNQIPPDVRPKLVGSRSFALEYDLEEVGRWGLSKVELWGTRDGGQTWRRYAEDDDNRSPLVVTVDEAGLYGFRIVVESGGTAIVPPASGDAPELWVAVDLQQPVAELTAIELGAGNMADHLILRWRADDNNLEPRPISLYYSSRPAGPWSAVATSLENTGEYAWRVERHVPTRFYLRLEARDTAGNLAAFQTREPVEFGPPAPSVRLRSVEPIDPTATGGTAAYR